MKIILSLLFIFYVAWNVFYMHHTKRLYVGMMEKKESKIAELYKQCIESANLACSLSEQLDRSRDDNSRLIDKNIELSEFAKKCTEMCKEAFDKRDSLEKENVRLSSDISRYYSTVVLCAPSDVCDYIQSVLRRDRQLYATVDEFQRSCVAENWIVDISELFPKKEVSTSEDDTVPLVVSHFHN